MSFQTPFFGGFVAKHFIYTPAPHFKLRTVVSLLYIAGNMNPIRNSLRVPKDWSRVDGCRSVVGCHHLSHFGSKSELLLPRAELGRKWKGAATTPLHLDAWMYAQ